MSNVRCMDQPSTRNGSKNLQLLATTINIASLSSQTVQHQRLMRILKFPPSYIESNFVKVRDSTANTDTEPHAYNPLCCDRASQPLLAKSNRKQLKSNWRPDQGMANQRIWVATTVNRYTTISSLEDLLRSTSMVLEEQYNQTRGRQTQWKYKHLEHRIFENGIESDANTIKDP